MNIRGTIAVATLAGGFFSATAIQAQNATTPGAVTTPYPTLSNLSVEWEISGDDDLDGVVAVRYRISGIPQWRDGLPLRRVPAGSNLGSSWNNKHSGSVLDLTPGTEYEIRNVMYNIIYSPFKLHRGSVGDVAFHNTVVKCGDALAVYTGDTWSWALFRNNLFIGGEGGGDYGGYSNGSGRVAQLAAADVTCHFNHDGFGSIGTGSFSGRIGSTSFSSLAEMRANTTETDGVEVDMDVFENNVDFPATGPFPERTIPLLILKTGSAAVDKGEVLANINDGFEGSAPDLGAYELGADPPIYGPRMMDSTPPKAPTNLTVVAQ